ncbi:hypothetical protein GOP47_0023967 [Adiantum capillus-veneris]|uniref:Protein kinase domain-containing protein n=1 Tax=Adiantum capillus-veneris TaxID=13818 RepID=A0A9D4Z5P2_ADICA|nr:hypothetical protein GOP47_0023967 [Adiantum capillus-veneris]
MAPACCHALESHSGLEVVQELGQGGQGLVLLCTDQETNTQRVACKTIRKRKLTAEEHFTDTQLRWEAQVLEYLSDIPGVLPLVATFEGDDTCFHLLTAFCDAGDLLAKLDSRPPLFKLDDREAAPIIASLARTIARCHARDIMHRDIKPGNILFRHINGSDVQEAVLADFGLAATLAPGETLCDCVGTPRYQAPEVIKGCYDHRADIWSLGVVVHVLLTSTLPFGMHCLPRDASICAIHEAILCNHLELDAFGLSSSTKDLLTRILCKDPDSRLTLDELLCHPWLHLNTASDLVTDHQQIANVVGPASTRITSQKCISEAQSVMPANSNLQQMNGGKLSDVTTSRTDAAANQENKMLDSQPAPKPRRVGVAMRRKCYRRQWANALPENIAMVRAV